MESIMILTSAANTDIRHWRTSMKLDALRNHSDRTDCMFHIGELDGYKYRCLSAYNAATEDSVTHNRDRYPRWQ